MRDRNAKGSSVVSRRPADLVLGLVLLGVALLPAVLGSGVPRSGWLMVSSPAGEWRYRLEKPRVFLVPGTAGRFAVSVSNGQAWVSESHCPDRRCRAMGPIATAGETIVCLPQRIVVTVEGGPDSGVDAVCE